MISHDNITWTAKVMSHSEREREREIERERRETAKEKERQSERERDRGMCRLMNCKKSIKAHGKC